MNITKVIEQVSKEYIELNQLNSPYDINNGFCEDFVLSVIMAMGGYKENLYELSGDMFFNTRDIDFAKENWHNIIETEYGIWAKDLLDYGGYPLNIDLNKVKEEFNHTWICFNDRHYDAETPKGVTKWYNLPLIKRALVK